VTLAGQASVMVGGDARRSGAPPVLLAIGPR
jgi:hypothetical protein